MWRTQRYVFDDWLLHIARVIDGKSYTMTSIDSGIVQYIMVDVMFIIEYAVSNLHSFVLIDSNKVL